MGEICRKNVRIEVVGSSKEACEESFTNRKKQTPITLSEILSDLRKTLDQIADIEEHAPALLSYVENALDQMDKAEQEQEALVSLISSIDDVLAFYSEKHTEPQYCSTSLLSRTQASRRVLH